MKYLIWILIFGIVFCPVLYGQGENLTSLECGKGKIGLGESQYYVKLKCGNPLSEKHAGRKIIGRVPVKWEYEDGKSVDKMMDVEEIFFRGKIYPGSTIVEKWQYCLPGKTRKKCRIYNLFFVDYELVIIELYKKNQK